MPFLMWSGNYSVRIQAMDEQHRKLVDLINQLHDGISAGKGQAVLCQVLDALADYTRTHFTAEERLMQSGGFPGFAKHKAEHDALISKVKAIQKQAQAGQTEIGSGLLSFLREWLINHIMGSDKAYSAYLNGKVLV